MSTSLRTKAPAAFVCACGGMARSACEGLPFYKVHDGKQYCVLHHPSKEKRVAFRKVMEKKLEVEDFNFCGVWFPDAVDFSNLTFTEPVNFAFATFSAETTFKATFDKEAYFSSATFDAEANFSHSSFCAMASFYGATFNAEALFIHTIFGARAAFNSATFTRACFFYTTFRAEVDFDYAAFGIEVDFLYANFKDYVRFAGETERPVFSSNSTLSLQFARVEKPERVSFHTITLRPHWFININARKFEFINVRWDWRRTNTKQEIKSTDNEGISLAYRLRAIACWNLAFNAEENHRYYEASIFRYLAMDARRLEGWRSWRNLAYWILHRAYWVASGYGEQLRKAVLMLLSIWLFFALLYTQVGFVRWETRVSSEKEVGTVEARRDEVGAPLSWQRALTYSLGVMTLQKPEPRPATNAAQGLVMLETILGPVQAALLALAIRRKFMR